MPAFEQAFPGFVSSCIRLHDQLTPVALAVLVLSFAFFFWAAPPQPLELVKFIVKLFLIVLLITHADALINSAQTAIKSFVDSNVDARPENVAELYKQKFSEAQSDPELKDQGFWDMLFSANFFEAIMYAVLLCVSWIAMAVLFYIYILQKVVLLLCWVLSPLFFACFAIPTLSGLALRHILRIAGVVMWPLGLALAATVTQGLLDAQTNQRFFALGPVTGSFGYALQNLFAVAAVGLWILFSTVLAPLFIQRLVSGAGSSGGLIPRAAELLINTGIPFLAHSVSSFRRSGEGSRQPVSSNENSSRSLINVGPPPTSPVEPPTLRQVSDDDPTAANAVRQALDQDSEEDS